MSLSVEVWSGSWRPWIPPHRPCVLRGVRLRIRGKLCHTRTGARRWWYARGLRVGDGTSLEPLVDYRLDGTVYCLGEDVRFSDAETMIPWLSPVLAFGGSTMGSKCLALVGEFYDLSARDQREQLFREIDQRFGSGRLRYRQGDLEIYAIDMDLNELLLIVSSLGLGLNYAAKATRFFDHWISKASFIGLDNKRILYVHGPAYVTSPNHPFDEIVLESGCYLVKHPFPGKEAVPGENTGSSIDAISFEMRRLLRLRDSGALLSDRMVKDSVCAELTRDLDPSIVRRILQEGVSNADREQIRSIIEKYFLPCSPEECEQRLIALCSAR